MRRKTFKIVYDIAQPDSRIKAGIFKVTDNILNSLACKKECLIFIDVSKGNTIQYYDYILEKRRLTNRIDWFFPENKIIKLSEKFVNKCTSDLDRHKPYIQSVPYRFLRVFFRVIIFTLKFLYIKKRKDKDLIYFSVFSNFSGYLDNDIKKRFIIIHDVIPIVYPQYFDNNFNRFFKKMIQSLNRNHYIFCVSKTTKRDLLNFNKNIDPNKVRLLPLAAAKHFKVNNDSKINKSVSIKYGIDPLKDYILSVCTFEPRKNIDSLIRVYVRSKKEKKLDNIQLVLIGISGWKYNDILNEIEKAKEIFPDDIIITGYVEEEDLSAIYSNALMFVYPSYYEGFGLPVLEAMQCGTPVITSNISSLPEVAGDAALYIDPNDENSIYEAVITLSESEQQRKILSAKGVSRASRFSWVKTADIIMKSFQSSF